MLVISWEKAFDTTQKLENFLGEKDILMEERVQNHEFDKEIKCESLRVGGGAKGEVEREFQADFSLSTELDLGLNLTIHKTMI